MTLHASPILAAFARQSTIPNTNTGSSSQVIPTTLTTAQLNEGPSPSTETTSGTPKRMPQNVLTNSQRAKVAKWMIDYATNNNAKHVISGAVKQFPALFRGSYKANLQKASRYWRDRETLIIGSDKQSKTNTYPFIRTTKSGLKRQYCKSRPGRGRKTAAWVQALHADLFAEFNRMKKAGVKFNATLLRRLARSLIAKTTEGPYHSNMIDSRTNDVIQSAITQRWIQTFMQRFHIVSRYQCGKLMVSPAKQEQIEREVAFHLGELARDFRSNQLREEDVFNADETHFCMNMDDHKTLAIVGEKNVRYADVVSGDDGITMMVLIAGGPSARLEIPMLIFKNAEKNYPIRGVPDDVPGVVYRTGPRAWMDKRVFLEWVREKRVFAPLPNGRKRVLYVDNVHTHDITENVKEALAASNTEIRFFPCNATHLVQPADSFIIQKLKACWRKEWDEHKMGVLERGMWSDGARGSGKLTNPGKRYFLKLAAKSVRAVSAQRDEDGVSYARKAMIRCGMAMNLNGQWEERQLFPELQAIISKYRENFDGQVVGGSS